MNCKQPTVIETLSSNDTGPTAQGQRQCKRTNAGLALSTKCKDAEVSEQQDVGRDESVRHVSSTPYIKIYMYGYKSQATKQQSDFSVLCIELVRWDIPCRVNVVQVVGRMQTISSKLESVLFVWA